MENIIGQAENIICQEKAPPYPHTCVSSGVWAVANCPALKWPPSPLDRTSETTAFLERKATVFVTTTRRAKVMFPQGY